MSMLYPLLVAGSALAAFAVMSSSQGPKKAGIGAPTPDAEDKLYQEGKNSLIAAGFKGFGEGGDGGKLYDAWKKQNPSVLMEALFAGARVSGVTEEKYLPGFSTIGAAIRARLGRIAAGPNTLSGTDLAMLKSNLDKADKVYFSAAGKSETDRWLPSARAVAAGLVAEALKMGMGTGSSGKTPTFEEAYQELLDAWISADPAKTLAGGSSMQSVAAIPALTAEATTLANLYRERAARLGAAKADLDAFDKAWGSVGMMVSNPV